MKTQPPPPSVPTGFNRYTKLEEERVFWVSKYIEWNEAGFDPEAKIALGYVRKLRWEIDRMNHPRVDPPPTLRIPKPRRIP